MEGDSCYHCCFVVCFSVVDNILIMIVSSAAFSRARPTAALSTK